MSKILPFVRLELISVKPYFSLKHIFILMTSLLVIVNITKNVFLGVGIFLGIGSIYANYPFSISESNGMDLLYLTLPTTRKVVILGRYLYAVFIDILNVFFAFVYLLGISLIMRIEYNLISIIAITGMLFVVIIIMQAIQFPMYFKVGYEKAMLFSYIPFFILYLLLFLGNLLTGKVSNNNVVLNENNIFGDITALFDGNIINVFIVILFGIIICFFTMFISYCFSIKFYNEREF